MRVSVVWRSCTVGRAVSKMNHVRAMRILAESLWPGWLNRSARGLPPCKVTNGFNRKLLAEIVFSKKMASFIVKSALDFRVSRSNKSPLWQRPGCNFVLALVVLFSILPILAAQCCYPAVSSKKNSMLTPNHTRWPPLVQEQIVQGHDRLRAKSSTRPSLELEPSKSSYTRRWH